MAEPPQLSFWTDSNGKAGEKTVIAADFGLKGGQPEHMANGLFPAMDNWIYSAAHSARYRFQKGKWVAQVTRSRGQWGVTQDDFGRLYYNSNSDLARVDPFPAQYFARNPYYQAPLAQNVQMILPANQEVFPIHPTPGVNRGYSPNELRDDGTLHHPTATCGLCVYRGDLFGPEFKNNLFIPEPAANVMKRMIVNESAGRMSASEAYEKMDFLTSTDERFRPVNAYNGPDGGLYVVDLYRGVLQHTAFLTNYLIKNIKERKLKAPIHMGRIYRIVPDGKAAKPVKLAKDIPGLVEQLGSANGWVRDMAQRLLVEKNDDDSAASLEKVATAGATPVARLHALWTLEGINNLQPEIILKALTDADAHVRAAAIRLIEPQLVPTLRAQALPQVLKLATDTEPNVQLQLALTLSAISDPAADELLVKFLTSSAAAPELMRDAVISGLRGRELEFAQLLLANPGWSSTSPDRAQTLTSLAQCVLAEHRSTQVKHLLEIAAAEQDGSWRQVALLRGMLPKFSAMKKPATSPATAPTASAILDGPASKPASQPSPVPLKIVYLDAQPEGLVMLLASNTPAVRDLARQVNSQLAWPGKPGVPPPPKIVPLNTAQQAQFDRGKTIFAQTCAACHQPTGMGQEGLAPPLVDSEWVLGSDRRLVRIVLQGLAGPIGVGGAQYNLEMPSLATFPDQDIADVLTYIRREWEHNASPVSAETAKQVHEEVKDRAEPWTARELLEIK